MRNRPVIWAPAAQRDLFRILRYITDRDPAAADRVGVQIQAAVASLGDAATGRPGSVANTFEKVVRGLPYIVAYQIVVVSASAEQLTKLHIVHGARDWPDGHWPIV